MKHYSKDYSVCPHCGYDNKYDCDEPAFYTEGCHEVYCGECAGEYIMNTFVKFSYETRLKEEVR